MTPRLSAQDIYNKEFTVGKLGYNADEVDGLLDDVIEDYQNYEEQVLTLTKTVEQCDRMIKNFQTGNEELTLRNSRLESELAEMKDKVAQLEASLKEADEQLSDLQAKAQAEAEAKAARPLSLEERVTRLEEAVFAAAEQES